MTLAEPLAPWNPDSLRVMRRALARGYQLALTAPEYGTRVLVFLRRATNPSPISHDRKESAR